MKTAGVFAALVLVVTASSMRAGVIPYPNTGTIAPQVPAFASTSQGVEVYYFGSSASYNDSVEVYDMQTSFNSGAILPNHSTVLGSELTVGSAPGQINAGDQLVFYIVSPEGTFASIASSSADGVNHAYITDYAGGTLNGTQVPAGVFVGLEDEAASHSDFNYNDDTFVFAGVTAPTVNVTPEPSSLVLFGTGMLGLAKMAHRRLRGSASA